MSENKKVLAVDDSITMLTVLRLCLEKEGHSVDTASSGEQALSYLACNEYDVIFADYNMPSMDGITLTKKIRRLPSHKDTPVVIVTTESQIDKKSQGKDAGATGWVVKPFKPDQLVSVIKAVTK